MPVSPAVLDASARSLRGWHIDRQTAYRTKGIISSARIFRAQETPEAAAHGGFPKSRGPRMDTAKRESIPTTTISHRAGHDGMSARHHHAGLRGPGFPHRRGASLPRPLIAGFIRRTFYTRSTTNPAPEGPSTRKSGMSVARSILQKPYVAKTCSHGATRAPKAASFGGNRQRCLGCFCLPGLG